MPDTPALDAAADALLQIVVRGTREQVARRPEAGAFHPFTWRDPTTIPTRDALDLGGLASDPIGTACRAELRRIGHAIHAAGGIEALDEAEEAFAEMDPTHAAWRAIVLETAWAGIGRRIA